MGKDADTHAVTNTNSESHDCKAPKPDSDRSLLLEWIKLAFQMVTVILALLAFYISVEKDHRDRFQVAYRALGDKYHDLLKFLLDKPKLDAFDVPLAKSPALSEAEQYEQKIVYAMLINHFEQAYTLLHEEKDFWAGWDCYIDGYLRRPRFRELWKEVEHTWGAEFRNHMNERLGKLGATSQP